MKILKVLKIDKTTSDTYTPPLASISGGPGGGAPSGLTLKEAKYVLPPSFFLASNAHVVLKN